MSILTNTDAYKYWRDEKLNTAITRLDDCIVEIKNPQLLPSEKQKISELNAINNFAIIQLQLCDDYTDKVLQINTELGLTRTDGHLYASADTLARITPVAEKTQGEFIPYTNKQINWHTDGYYNSPENRVRAFTLFCAHQAGDGGTNGFVDNEILYILLREKNPELAELLTRSDAMTIPEHIHNGVVRREKSVGAIFSMDAQTGSLYMRYTQRKKNIEFNELVIPAVQELDKILNTTGDYHFSHLMDEGQGIICNNIIHRRASFVEDKEHPRLMLRGRYLMRVS